MIVNLALVVLAFGIPFLALAFYGMAKTPSYSDINEICGVFSVIGTIAGIFLIFFSLTAGITVDLSKLVQFHESAGAQEAPTKMVSE